MKLRAIKYLLLLAFLGVHFLSAQIERVEPPHWWVGMENDTLQLLVYGKEIADYKPSILKCQGCPDLIQYHKGDSPNYLFLDIWIPDYTLFQSFQISFGNTDSSESFSYRYELKPRIQEPEDFQGFDTSDVIYLITPDRFSNGNPKNDVVDGLLETDLDRSHDYKRHGGDIQVTVGSANSGAGGDVVVAAGATTAAAQAGAVRITGGASTGTAATGGVVSITSGSSASGSTGAVTI